MPWSLLSLRELIWICNLVSTHPLPLFTHYLTPLPLLSKSLLRPGMIRQTPMHPAGPSLPPALGHPSLPLPTLVHTPPRLAITSCHPSCDQTDKGGQRGT